MFPNPRIAAQRGGVFTLDDARASGLTDADVRRLVRAGAWTRLGRGVLTAEFVSGDALADHPLLVAAAIAASPGAVASHTSAARLWQLPLAPGADLTPTLTRDTYGLRKPSHHGGVEVNAARLPDAHWTTREGIALTTVARTVADIARQGSLRDGLMAADHAVRERLATPQELVAAAAFQRGWPGVRTARATAELAVPTSESPGESASRAFFVKHNLPLPVGQQVIRAGDGRFVARVDFYWPESRTVGEFDGLLKYTESRVLREEKIRQEAIEALGHRVVRWTWRQLHDEPERTRARICASLTARHDTPHDTPKGVVER